MKHILSSLTLLAVLFLTGCQKITIPQFGDVTISENLSDSVFVICPISGTKIDKCGFCLGKTSSNLVVEKAKWLAEGTIQGDVISGGIAGLTPNTIYYVAAYAENAAGIAYSAPLRFTTAPRVPVSDDNLLPTLKTE